MEKVRKEAVLTRDDFDGGPVSLDLIEENLYLGNVTAACDIPTLTELNIKYILTIDSVPLPRHITENENFITKYIQITDIPKEDILSVFECTNMFISEALDNNLTILVHCYYGMSRSAAIIIAYFMNKYNLQYEEAYQRVKSKRNLVSPNPGFITQLKLYGSMGSKIDRTNNKYKMYRLKIAADKVRKVKILPQSCMELIQPDPALLQERPDPLVYRCRKCRRILACQSNVITHKKGKSVDMSNTSQNDEIKTMSDMSASENEITNSSISGDDVATIGSKTKSTSENSQSNESINIPNMRSNCSQTYFVEPIAWMKEVTHNTQGKLYCPHCKNKLGSFNWLMGCQCPCGTKVSPAFYLVPSKVEWSNVVQNIESTI
ncbi:dual specificity protein phosphatase MPK-4-like isoform X2 [Ctenocephalides felis]|uniref:dual specificity protein phosphatase MPK-4-like isoform X2 n=1 Tax=Ctenocephalides felis TaxID=7515 RepID=UPI000E6E39A6|nr:dual specificity protein phosphatase MPK-4-like isoform X2 [Ctenocephalides felis]